MRNITWRIEMFGGLSVHRPGRTIARFKTRKTAILLAYLAFYPDRTHPREELVENLWPDSEPDAGRTNLRVALNSLRRQLEPPGTEAGSVLLADRASVRLNPHAFSTDVADFEQAIQSAGVTPLPLTDRIELLAWAADLYRGPLLSGYYESWIVSEQQRLAGVFLRTLQQLVAMLQENGDTDRAILYAHRIISADPFQEEAYTSLIQLYAATGQYAAALRQYQQLEQMLREEFGQTPAPEISELAAGLQQRARPLTQVDPDRRRAAEPAANPSSPPPPTLAPTSMRLHLPLHLTRFIGRQEEISRLTQILSSQNTRLVIVTGPGGCGKTRFVIETAAALAATYTGTVCFVPLAAITRASEIEEAILQALCLERSPGLTAREQIVSYLDRQPSLLILDNLEHLLPDAAGVIWTLLDAARTLTCLATSRQRVYLEGAQEFPLLPLPVPAQSDTPERLLEYPAVQLFVDRAQLARPDFQITPGNAASIAALCARLEGLPLAIELAASRAQMLTLRQMLEQLEDRLQMLTRDRSDVSDRHRSLRAALDWSYGLLSPTLQRFFVSLSVFRGGWTTEAAAAVSGDTAILEHLEQLRARSLIFVIEQEWGMRYRVMATVRDYAGEQLSPEERAELSRRHADYFLQFVEEMETKLEGNDQIEALNRLEQEHDNLRAALHWLESDPSSGEAGMRLAGALWRFWYIRGYAREASVFYNTLLSRPDAQRPIPARAKSLLGAGIMATKQNDFAVANGFLMEAQEIFTQHADQIGIALAEHHLGIIAHLRRDYATARHHYERSLTIWRARGNRPGIANALRNLGVLAEWEGDLNAASALYGASLTLFRQLGERRGIAGALFGLGRVSVRQYAPEAARTLLEECRLLYEELGDKAHLGATLNALGSVSAAQGDLGAAQTLLDESLALYQQTGDWVGYAAALRCRAEIAEQQGELPAAVALHEQAAAILREQQDEIELAYTLRDLGRLVALQGDLDQAFAQYSEALAHFQSVFDPQGQARILHDMGALAGRSGDQDKACALLTQCLILCQESGDRMHAILACETAALLAAAHAPTVRAAKLLAAAQALRAMLSLPASSRQQEEIQTTIGTLQSALGKEAFDAAWAEGSAMMLPQAISYALEDPGC
ncbi:MAG TPA: tetratricopeptide repeat protein [Chthonomonadaceae bacterium]|nr:tetratricopeptide repeat protein [Chthonomonadaceae bacterium]